MSSMPVMLCKSVLREKDEDGGIFRCPCTKQKTRSNICIQCTVGNQESTSQVGISRSRFDI